MNAKKPNWEKAKNILVVRLDSMGDVIMTIPAMRALKESLPGRRITLLTSENGAKIAPYIREIDDVIIYEAPWVKPEDTPPDYRQEYRMAAKLQQAGFDGAVIFTVYSQNPLPSAFLCHLADIPLRLAHCHENPYQLLSNWVKDPEPEVTIRHEVRRQLDLVATIDATTEDEHLALDISKADLHKVEQLLTRSGLDLNKPWVMIHPGASAASRRYPVEYYEQVASRLASEWGFQIVLSGKKQETKLIDQIVKGVRPTPVSLAGKLSIGELIALISLAPILVTNNTGPAHIAASVGTPVVDLYALTNPQHTPWMVPNRVLSHDVPCKFCYKSVCPEGHHHCLTLIEPDQVVEAVVDLIQEVTEGKLPHEAVA